MLARCKFAVYSAFAEHHMIFVILFCRILCSGLYSIDQSPDLTFLWQVRTDSVAARAYIKSAAVSMLTAGLASVVPTNAASSLVLSSGVGSVQEMNWLAQSDAIHHKAMALYAKTAQA